MIEAIRAGLVETFRQASRLELSHSLR